MSEQNRTYPQLTWPMIEAFLDWDVARVNDLIGRGIPRTDSEWRIAEGHVKEFYHLMMKASSP